MIEYLFWNYSLCFFGYFFPPSFFLQSNLNPGHYKASRLHRFSSALTGDPEENAALPGAPCSRKMSRQVSPAAHTKVPMEQNLSVISGSTTLHSLESDIISSDDDEGEDTCSSTASNSLPSPEVFRKERSSVWNFCASSTTMQAFSAIFVFTCVYRWSTNLLLKGRDTSCSSQ